MDVLGFWKANKILCSGSYVVVRMTAEIKPKVNMGRFQRSSCEKQPYSISVF